MGGRRDVKVSKTDLRAMRNQGKCKVAQGELQAARRSARRKVKDALRKDQEPPGPDSIPYMY